MTTLAERLAAFAHGLSFDDLPRNVVHEVKRRVIDSIGCAIGAFDSEPCRIARTVARLVTSRYPATLIGTAHASAPDLAAFANGTMIRYLDYNDTYLSKEPAHPSDNIAAALAVAEAEGAGGKALIASIVVGYEIQCRLCDAAALRTRGWDHVTYGPLSTALVAAKLMGLPQASMVHALGLAGVPNIALRQTRVGDLSMWKGCAFANAARNGVFAAWLAKQGMTGPAPLFEGEKGFFRQVTGPFDLPPLAEKGRPFKIMDTYIKFYPAEYHAQSAIEAALLLRPNFALKDIRTIAVKTFDVAVEIIGKDPEKWRPRNRETADHSLPYLVAVALMDGRVGLDQFTEARIADRRLQALIQKVAVTADPAFDRAYPEAMPNQVQVKTVDGRSHALKVTYPKGHPKRPLTDSELEAKFSSLAEPRLSKKQIRRLLDRLWKLDALEKMDDLLSLCIVPGKRKGRPT
ncbi:MAG TPA: MmgE/PrpD family protein [Nitrospiria bacterium]|nr:MmgE/PrpD family protein [Nitrospiria bacterium]